MNQQETLNVVFSMDCLPAGGREEVHGAERWDDAHAAPAAFAECLMELGFKATFFVAPEAAGRLRHQIEQLSGEGCEVGLLCHPQLSGYQACLGSYSYDRQREIVGLARTVWDNELSEPPAAFRPGFFSANDYTYHVACMEGFSQGSCSLPGRMDNDQCSMWYQAYPFPHHTDPLDRSAAGTMEFLEVPVTSDFEAASFLTGETYTPPHLRIEEPDFHEYAGDLIYRQLERMQEDQVDIKVIHFVTSNVVAWHRDEDPHCARLKHISAMLDDIADEEGLQVRWVSLETLHEELDEALGVGLDEE